MAMLNINVMIAIEEFEKFAFSPAKCGVTGRTKNEEERIPVSLNIRSGRIILGPPCAHQNNNLTRTMPRSFTR